MKKLEGFPFINSIHLLYISRNNGKIPRRQRIHRIYAVYPGIMTNVHPPDKQRQAQNQNIGEKSGFLERILYFSPQPSIVISAELFFWYLDHFAKDIIFLADKIFGSFPIKKFMQSTKNYFFGIYIILIRLLFFSRTKSFRYSA